MQNGVIFSQYRLQYHYKAVSQLIAMAFGTLIELTYVINFAKFGGDRSLGFGLVSSQILRYCLNLRSRP